MGGEAMTLDDVLHKVVAERTATYDDPGERKGYAALFEAYRVRIAETLPKLLVGGDIDAWFAELRDSVDPPMAEPLRTAHVKADLAAVAAFVEKARETAMRALMEQMHTKAPLYVEPQPLAIAGPTKLTPGWEATEMVVTAAVHRNHHSAHTVVYTTDGWASEQEYEGEADGGIITITAPVPSFVAFATKDAFGARSDSSPVVIIRMAAPKLLELIELEEGDEAGNARATFDMPHGAQYVEYFVWGTTAMRAVLAQHNDNGVALEPGSKVRARALAFVGGEPIWGKGSEDVAWKVEGRTQMSSVPRRRTEAKSPTSKPKTKAAKASKAGEEAKSKETVERKVASHEGKATEDDEDKRSTVKIQKGSIDTSKMPVRRPDVMFTGEYSEDGDLLVASHTLTGKLTRGLGLAYRVGGSGRFKKIEAKDLPNNGTFILDLDGEKGRVEILAFRGSSRSESVSILLPQGDRTQDIDIDDEWFSKYGAKPG